MGQIVSSAAKPKRCNLQSLSSLDTPAAGEYILVSSDNSMNASGQGNFDCYIVGDGKKAATALPLIKTYANDVDEKPTAGSNNLVRSGGVYPIMLQAEQMGTILESELPAADYVDSSFSIGGGGDSRIIYYDTRNVLPAHALLKEVKIYARTASTLYLRFISERSVQPQIIELSTSVGMNVYNNIPVSFPYDVYVGVVSPSACIGMKTGGTHSASIGVDDYGYTSITYAIGMSIKVWEVSNFLKKEVDSNSSDLEKIKNNIGIVKRVELPTADWWANSFPSLGGSGDGDSVLFDTRCVVDGQHQLKALSINIKSTGILRVYLLGMDYSVVAYRDLNAIKGVQTIPLEFEADFYTQKMYVGICSFDANYIGVASMSNNFSRYLALSTGVVKSMTAYIIGYSIVIEDTSSLISNLISSLTPIPSDTIEDIISKGNNDIILGPYDYEVSAPISLASGMTIRGSFGKTRLILTDGCTTAISASNVSNIKISDLEIVGTEPEYNTQMNGIVAGDGYNLLAIEDIYVTYPSEQHGGSVRSTPHIANIGDEIGIYLYHSENIVLDSIKINHINGSALKVNYVGQNYEKGLNCSNLFITNCYNGIWTENEHEFSQYTNFTITKCQVGVLMSSGNLIFNGGHITKGRVGIAFTDGYNHGHGIIDAIEIKHNQLYGIYAKDCNYGECIGTASIQYAPILLDNCRGFIIGTLFFSSGTIICNNPSGYSQKNIITTILNQSGTTISETGNLEIVNQVIG